MGTSECCRKIRNHIDRLHDRGAIAPAIIFFVLHCLAGIALLAIAVWMYIDTSNYLAGAHNDKFFISVYILMGAGSLMALVGFLGCCGAMQESSCMLATFATFVLIIFAAEVAGTVYGWSHKDEVKGEITKRVRDMVRNEYSIQEAVTLAVDAMQTKLKCCGVEDPSDWKNSVYNHGLKDPTFVDKLTSNLQYRVPVSCCSLSDSFECEKQVTTQSVINHDIYSKGCINSLEDKIKSHLSLILGIGIGIAVIQIFGFVFSLVLCCAISGDRY